MKSHLYYYRALVKYVYDGDTITVDIDLGLHAWMHDEKIRMARINTPELKNDEREAGLKSRDYLRGLIEGKEIFLQTFKDEKGKYGRYIAEVWLEQSPNEWINVNDLLVEKGYARYASY
ncbi:MAG: thermonuclease family protein [Gammaproteobacteria bacterium]|nr:thermonuclease family protein [Gammaproteobacteria bacterium]